MRTFLARSLARFSLWLARQLASSLACSPPLRKARLCLGKSIIFTIAILIISNLFDSLARSLVSSAQASEQARKSEIPNSSYNYFSFAKRQTSGRSKVRSRNSSSNFCERPPLFVLLACSLARSLNKIDTTTATSVLELRQNCTPPEAHLRGAKSSARDALAWSSTLSAQMKRALLICLTTSLRNSKRASAAPAESFLSNVKSRQESLQKCAPENLLRAI